MFGRFAKSFFATVLVAGLVAGLAAAYFRLSPAIFAGGGASGLQAAPPDKAPQVNGRYYAPASAELPELFRVHLQLAELPERPPASLADMKNFPERLRPEREIANWRRLPHFVEGNMEAYLAFAARRPELDEDTVAWMVNANAHVPHYTDIITDHSPMPLLVNRNHRLPGGFVPGELVRIRTATWLMLVPEAEEAFERMRADARIHGFELRAFSAYRSAERQAEILGDRVRSNSVATPYHSEHQTGRAIDLQNGRGEWLGSCPEALWVARNAHRFGFIVRYTEANSHITGFINEPWHVTYVGLDIAMHMQRHGIGSLEEFVGRNPGAMFGWAGG